MTSGAESSTAAGGAPRSRRERTRAATHAEIVDTARRFLVSDGPAAITLRAIAREMGMTAPALYRYVGSHQELLDVLITALFDELSDELEAARDAAGDAVEHRMRAACRAFRRWALANPAELGLLFGSPLPSYAAAEEGPTRRAGGRFGGVFLGLFVEAWDQHRFPVRDDAEVDPRLVTELAGWQRRVLGGEPLPMGVLELFLRSWMRLYGAVTMEGFGQLRFAVEDAEPLFELELAELSRLLGFPPEPPRAG
jgi:AcrR family transcriptional regulator